MSSSRSDDDVLHRCAPVTVSEVCDGELLVPPARTPTATLISATNTPTTTSTTTSNSRTTTPPADNDDDEEDDEKEAAPPPPPAHKKNGPSCTILEDDSHDAADGREQQIVDEDHQHCNLCSNSPCLLEEGLYEELALAYELGLDPDFTFLTNKEIRFRLYKHATSWIHGYLGKDNRIELPQYVTTEIRHLAPESSGFYVGFKKRRVDSNPQEDY
jgi:hypothetical protein